MEEINLKDLFSYFFKKTPIILFVTLLFLTVGIIYTMFIKTPLYKGDTTLILVKQDSNYGQESSSQTQSDILLNQKLVTTYSELIKSKRVLNQVISILELDCTNLELSQKISVSSVKDTEIIKISVSDEEPKDASRIANTLADVFKYEVMDIYDLQNVTIIDKAEVQDEPYNIEVIKSAVIFFALGFMLSVGVIFVIYYFDTSIKSSEEIENRLGVPVIGNVPKC